MHSENRRFRNRSRGAQRMVSLGRHLEVIRQKRLLHRLPFVNHEAQFLILWLAIFYLVGKLIAKIRNYLRTRMRIIGSYHYMAPELLIPERITGTDEDAVQARRVQLAKVKTF